MSITLTQDNSLIRVEVAETSAGIPPETLPHIFERFYRVDKARAKSDGGVGLGLAIVKSIATLHGGSVDITSQSGGGTRVTLSFPQATNS